ncbi:MAG: alpha/beta fold hydrolase [Deltaproteobacteria bacterium]|nr:alpha/beta fold hydrolase [Deltaproteobacteria bacterium]
MIETQQTVVPDVYPADSALPMRALPGEHGPTACIVAGRGAAVVCLHDFGSAAAEWIPLLHALKQDYTVHAVDLLGHGRTSAPRLDYSPAIMVAWLGELLTQLQLSQVTLIGSGFGAALALVFAAQHPARVKDLVLVGPSIPGVQPSGRAMYWAFWLIHQPRLKGLFAALWPRLIERMERESVLDQRLLSPLQAAVRMALRRREVCAAQGSMIRQWHHWLGCRPAYGQIGQPLLLLWGGADQLYPVRHARLLTTLVPHAELAILDDCGHLPHLERPTEVARLLQAFLRTRQRRDR